LRFHRINLLINAIAEGCLLFPANPILPIHPNGRNSETQTANGVREGINMPRHENYPDDVRQYDNDPRSPFYDNSREDALYDARDALAAAWRDEYDKTGVVGFFGGDPRDECLEGESLGSVLDRFALLEVEQNPPTEDGW
jgi:hypothetical protein